MIAIWRKIRRHIEGQPRRGDRFEDFGSWKLAPQLPG
jgi:hypothetical protein